MIKQRIPFLCTHNSARSRVAKSVHDRFVSGRSWTF